jgi:DNA-binding XRE family transcriptional regulator
MIKNNVEQYRLRKNKTKAFVAFQIKVNRSTLTRLEQGAIQPSAKLMFKLADYFKCKIDDLFYWVKG